MNDMPKDARSPLNLHEMAFSLGVTAALMAAVRLDVPDALGDRPTPVGELAEAVGADPEALNQLMRALAVRGVFRQDADGLYSHSDASKQLRKDTPGSRRTMVLLASAPFAWQIWSRLDDAVRTGRSVCGDMFGKDLFEYLHETDPELGALFDRAMSKSGAATMEPIVEALELDGVATVADIGGGHGTLLRMVLERHPGVGGVLFDLPSVVAGADPELRTGGLAGRCRVLGGDCHRDVPVKADLYLLKNVVHMWDDAAAVKVLRTIARNAPAGARIVLVEQLLDLTRTPGSATAMDLLMLVSQGGRERTTAGFTAVLERAGLGLRTVAPAGPTAHLIEAVVPAGNHGG
jgi:C-methyltransferase